ncbi:PEP-CTERM sorting domain-containing protein [Methylophilus sp. YYY-1]|jgi:uncharacterized protein (DUF2141 family)|uniref:PEP-CTERM sorting domain-containing protein n=1 Tax=Methylophilus sp. YYY-1 TaxID=2682087 RepID=UPI0023B220AA|nr:PEP-CTERM sorting domain-containing protein [Methylophilus sp. YYY-1]MDF0378239.1 PEP-CTERM sorting domain-containing protein [Methylophilus sp. YYY-1]
MKRILFFTIGLFLSLTAQSAVIYQSGAYGAGLPYTWSQCSNCEFASDQFIGEAFSTTATYSISSLDFYAQRGYSGTGDLTIAFFDALNGWVHSETFTPDQQTKSDIDIFTTNISLTFSPFQLEAGNYAVFFFGKNLGVLTFNEFDATQLIAFSRNGTTTDPQPYIDATYSSAILLSGMLTTVPEPESIAMLLAGLGFLAVLVRRKKQA